MPGPARGTPARGTSSHNCEMQSASSGAVGLEARRWHTCLAVGSSRPAARVALACSGFSAGGLTWFENTCESSCKRRHGSTGRAAPDATGSSPRRRPRCSLQGAGRRGAARAGGHLLSAMPSASHGVRPPTCHSRHFMSGLFLAARRVSFCERAHVQRQRAGLDHPRGEAGWRGRAIRPGGRPQCNGPLPAI